MRLEPEATIPASTAKLIAEAYGLGEALESSFVARGAMGSVNRLSTVQRGEHRHWTVKRSFWNQYSEQTIAKEVEFTTRCVSIGVSAPGSFRSGPGSGHCAA